MKENDLFMQEVIGNLDPALLEESEKAPAKRHRPAPMRVLMVAACICALLVVGAAAAEMAGVDVVETVRTMLGIKVSEPTTMGSSEKWKGWTVTLPETFTDERFTEEFLTELKAAPIDMYDIKRITKDFATLEELEEYLGTAPTINAILEQGDLRRTEEHKDLEEVWHLIAREIDTVDQDGVIDVCVYSNFAIPVPETEGELLSVFMEATFSTEEEPNRSVSGSFFTNVAEITQESYVTPNGLEAMIARVRFDPDGEDPNSVRGATYAEFYLDGFRCELSTHDFYDEAEVDEAKIAATLKFILDAFE
ncbi:MAG: hypothetical protein K2F83_07390 [Oscillospiraceae bacterium]|nr:hypothetical protein [Oscillospiraceae bacterium]